MRALETVTRVVITSLVAVMKYPRGNFKEEELILVPDSKGAPVQFTERKRGSSRREKRQTEVGSQNPSTTDPCVLPLH